MKFLFFVKLYTILMMHKMDEVKREQKQIRFVLKNNKFYVYENCEALIESRNLYLYDPSWRMLENLTTSF
jgi:hypothetical protein